VGCDIVLSGRGMQPFLKNMLPSLSSVCCLFVLPCDPEDGNSMLNFYQATQSHIQRDSTPHSQCCENLNSNP
jgi:hypothetical protein